jgi:hypothetical protein
VPVVPDKRPVDFRGVLELGRRKRAPAALALAPPDNFTAGVTSRDW